MSRVRTCLSLFAYLLLVGAGLAADAPPPLATAQGVLDKVEKDSLTVRPRGADGKFEKSVTLRLTGTSKISLLTTRAQKGRVVLVQNDASPSDLRAKQVIAVIYADGPDGPVLLSAVAQPVADK
jgi:hypothetical protein